MSRLFLGALVLAAMLPASSAYAQDRWTVTGSGNGAVLANCADCGEDIGMMVTCQGPGRPVLLSVPWQAQDTPPTGVQAELVFQIDGQVFRTAPQLDYQGMIGHVPQITLQPGDPLIAALKSGRAVTVLFGDRGVEISLNGSSEAFANFGAECGWAAQADLPAAPAEPTAPAEPAAPVTPQAADAQADPSVDAKWFASSYTDDHTGARVESLTYGLPETDAFAVSGNCSSDRVGPAVSVIFAADTGTRPHGDTVEIGLAAPGYEATYAGTVSLESSEYSGILVDISIKDGFWERLSDTGYLTFTPQDGEGGTIPLAGPDGPVAAFRNACRDVFAAYDAQAAPDSAAPVVYACEDGSSLTARYDNSRSYSVATITWNGRSEDLINAPSGSGSRYVNDMTELHTKGSEALLTVGETVLQCTEQ